ncbi:MAG: DUF2213 domain-containing protein [Rhodospirillaceae bacterium]|nr:MAG: DUF2213 domain-containing protein [Rhodospirillaceae bacterium]
MRIAMDRAIPAPGQCLALDRATVRSYDADGRLRVEITNISKANICPYFGREIPDFEALGLDPDKQYRLFRDPEELEKAAPTFNNLPLLSRHVPVSASDHKPDLVIGATGSDADFEAPYLRNSLVVWASEAIEAIEAETQKELSCAYRYRADMTPGEYDGEKYDGVMRDIVGNHVALVREGRAGPDVVVGDSAAGAAFSFDFTAITQERNNGMKTVLSRKATLAHGALLTLLAPKLAQDAKIDLTPALAKVTGENFKDKKADIATAVKDVVKGKLAQDANLDDLTGLLDALEAVETPEAADADPDLLPGGNPDDDTTMDSDLPARLKEFLKGKISDEDLAKIDALCGAPAAADEDDDPDKKVPANPAQDEDEDEEKKDMVTKPAMDAAIAAAVKTATEKATQTQREIRDAERAVHPYVGNLAMAHDSAEGVYRTALKMLGVEVKDVHASALPTILKLQPVPGSTPKKATVAMDAAGAAEYAKEFPQAARIGRA